MSMIDTLLERNHAFAERGFVPGLPMRPSLQTVIVGCADPRVDPVHVLGLAPGEALVVRNVGGRVTPGTLQLLTMLLQVPTGAPRAPTGESAPSPFHLIVLQHTDCGIKRLAANAEMMSEYFEVPPAELAAKAIEDPHAAVIADVAMLRAIPGVPPSLLVSGLVYDTETGLIEVVVPLAPIHPKQEE